MVNAGVLVWKRGGEGEQLEEEGGQLVLNMLAHFVGCYLKENWSEDASWAEHTGSVHMLHLLASVAGSVSSYRKEVLFSFESELLRVLPCWFTLCQWRATEGWLVTCLLLLMTAGPVKLWMQVYEWIFPTRDNHHVWNRFIQDPAKHCMTHLHEGNVQVLILCISNFS